MWPTRLTRYVPWAVGAAVFLMAGIVEDTRIPPFLGWQASKLWLNLAAVGLAALCGIAAAFAPRYTWPVLVMAFAAWFLAGLIGLSERLCLMDGTLHTGPRPDGGFRLHATLPIG